MNLDDQSAYARLDSLNLFTEIEALPERLQKAWYLGSSLALPPWIDFRQVLIAGMGVSALAGDLLGAYLAPICELPVFVLRNYTLPVWANGPDTLVICVSYSGETEEPRSIFEQAVDRGCRVLAITTGGALAEAARKPYAVLWTFDASSQTGEAVGEIFALLLGAFFRFNLIPAPGNDLAKAIADMKAQQSSLGFEVPIMQNEAKRLAGQCMGRWLTIFASDHLISVARYWKIQLNKFAKTSAFWEEIPEVDHHSFMGVINPAGQINQTMNLFLRARDCHPRNQIRTNLTKEFFMIEGLGTDFFNAFGETRLTQMLTALHFGDYLAYYLAILYEVEPGQVEAIAGLKEYIKNQEG